MSKRVLELSEDDLLDAAGSWLGRRGLLTGRVVATGAVYVGADGRATARFVTFETSEQALEYVTSLTKEGVENGERKG